MPPQLLLAKEATWLFTNPDKADEVEPLEALEISKPLLTGEDFAEVVFKICMKTGSNENHSLKRRMRNAASGCIQLLNQFRAYPSVHVSDEEYHRAEGQNWYSRPYGQEEELLNSVTFPSGIMHEMYYRDRD